MTNLNNRELQLRKKLAEVENYAVEQIMARAEEKEKLSFEVRKLQSMLCVLLVSLNPDELRIIADEFNVADDSTPDYRLMERTRILARRVADWI